ncbi:MAG: chorismate mutase [Alphaproteobacteria bacterium]|nr:chorismate mutase [Alphaproteobacteria bacterium]
MPLKPSAPSLDAQALADLRAQIDQVDGVMHDMLRERARIVEQIRKIKGRQSLYTRPGREAQLLRALTGRERGCIPDGLVVRMWREMFGAFTLAEGPMKVGVYAPAKGDDLWDVARDHFGSFMPLVEYTSAVEAIKALQDDKISVAFVPPPAADEKESWWPLLASDKSNSVTIFQAAPMEVLKAGRSNARRALPMGLLVGRLYPELTGDDRSYLALQSTHVPEDEMKRLLGKAGYKVRSLMAQTTGRGSKASTLFLVFVDGFIGRNDTRLGRIKAMLGSRLQRLMPLGGYPACLKAGGRR